MIRLANAITVSRYLLATVTATLLLMTEGSTSRIIAAGILGAAYLTDVVDGPVARHTGSASDNNDGAILDTAADDFTFATMFLCFVAIEVLDAWVALFAIWIRAFILLIRLVALSRELPYPRPRWSTRAQGATYAVGQVVLLGLEGFRADRGRGYLDVAHDAVVTFLIIATGLAIAHFGCTHRRLLVSLLVEERS